MVVKITRAHVAPPIAIAVHGDPLDELKQRVEEAVQRFRSAAVTPRSFLNLENELAALAANGCRQQDTFQKRLSRPDDFPAMMQGRHGLRRGRDRLIGWTVAPVQKVRRCAYHPVEFGLVDRRITAIDPSKGPYWNDPSFCYEAAFRKLCRLLGAQQFPCDASRLRPCPL